MIIISTLHDPEGRLLSIVRLLKKELSTLNLIIAVTNNTDKNLVTFLLNLGIQIVDGGRYGESRLSALRESLKRKKSFIFCCDFDKVLHWLLVDPKEFKNFLVCSLKEDFLILGRTKKVFATYPRSWKVTESIINHLVSKIINSKVDVLTGVYIFQRIVGEVIVKEAIETSWGACVEWPLLAQFAGLEINYREVKG